MSSHPDHQAQDDLASFAVSRRADLDRLTASTPPASRSSRPATIHRLPLRPSAALRWLVSLTKPDGSTVTWYRLGGSSIDHTLEAMDEGGLGSVVRVTRLAS